LSDHPVRQLNIHQDSSRHKKSQEKYSDAVSTNVNKRAQKALCRSPEEKVKGHSGANYRGPLILFTKYQGSSRFLEEDFQDFPIFIITLNKSDMPPGREA